MPERPRKSAPPELLTRIRKAWDIGVDFIVLQTVVQLDGDVIFRGSPDVLGSDSPLLKAHQSVTTVGLNHWQGMFQIVIDLLNRGISSLVGRGDAAPAPLGRRADSVRLFLNDLRTAFGLLMQPRRLSRLVGDAAVILNRNIALVQEFVCGGVVVPAIPGGGDWPALPEGATPENTCDRLRPADYGEVDLYSVIQLDGDLMLKVSRPFRARSKEEQDKELEAHLADVRARLAPVGDLHELVVAGMMLVGLLFSTGGLAVSAITQEFTWLLMSAAGGAVLPASRWAVGRSLGWVLKRKPNALMSNLS